MVYADGIECAHRCRAAVLTEIASVIIGKAQRVETRVAVILGVTRRGAEHVATGRVATLLRRLAAIGEHALEITEGNVSALQYGRNGGEKADAIVIG